MSKSANEQGAEGKRDALIEVLKLLYPLHKEIDRYLFDIALRRLFDELLEAYVEHEESEGKSALELDKYERQLAVLLEEVMACLSQSLASSKLDVPHLEALSKVAALRGDLEVATNTSQVVDILSSKEPVASVDCPFPISYPETEDAMLMLRHPRDSGPIAELMERVGSIFGELPKRSLKDDTEIDVIPDSPKPFQNAEMLRWIGEWADFIGLEDFDVVELPLKVKQPRAYPGSKPIVAVPGDLNGTPGAKERFFVGRSLFRASQGFGAFKVGEVAAPVRWLMAVVVAVTREFDDLPIPTARSFVDLLEPLLSPETRESLTEVCNDVLDQSKQDIASWVEAALFSADRFGLMVSGDPREVINWILEESSGSIGLERLKKDGPVVYSKVPRCQELLEFVLSDEYIALGRLIGKRTPSLIAPGTP